MAEASLKLALAQINVHVGAIENNMQKIIRYCLEAAARQADIVIFPELVITGYPPEDLLYREHFLQDVEAAVEQICQQVTTVDVVLSYPMREQGKLYNVAAWISGGIIQGIYRKQCLPNYSVFDEKRYFSAGEQAFVFNKCGVDIAISICEDIWESQPVQQAADAGAKLLLNLNASPFQQGKVQQREDKVSAKAKQHGLAVAYVNLLGGQDELVFDGGSFCVNSDGEIASRSLAFEEMLDIIEYDPAALRFKPSTVQPHTDAVASAYQAITLGIHDYVTKNHFNGVVFGLSGGIDSALTAALAVDALGSENVAAVAMPSRYTANMSNDDAEEEARLLDIDYQVIPIEPAFNAFLGMLEKPFAGTEADTAEENIQARCRGILLMAISNKTGKMLLTTGNKSEMSVGYATLYGDMAGGFAPIKDVPKQLVYQLANYRNSLGRVIPQRVIDRPPSAELRLDQQDSDSLPDYDVLDDILQRYVEDHQSKQTIVAAGHDKTVVDRITRLVDINEYKRRQAPPGVKITSLAFGRDRRFPLTNGYR